MRPDLEWENEYYKAALRHPELGLPARQYLENRGITQYTADYWELGWSPMGCIPTNFDKDDKSCPWKKHWGRLIIPIRDSNGTLISLSGRMVIKRSNCPKYDHYPFPARKVLFGLWNNKKNIQEESRVIITEGQIDVISAWQNGLKFVVSSFGAHCSLDHFAILSRYASTVDILYDEDAAGIKGTKMVADFPTWGDLIVNLRTGIFPAGEDLDSWIKKHSAKELIDLINNNETNRLMKLITR